MIKVTTHIILDPPLTPELVESILSRTEFLEANSIWNNNDLLRIKKALPKVQIEEIKKLINVAKKMNKTGIIIRDHLKSETLNHLNECKFYCDFSEDRINHKDEVMIQYKIFWLPITGLGNEVFFKE